MTLDEARSIAEGGHAPSPTSLRVATLRVLVEILDRLSEREVTPTPEATPAAPKRKPRKRSTTKG